MKLLIGLGNPGREYERTRHNVGFMVIDALAKRPIDGVMLVKPTTFMNRSGVAVKKLATSYQLPATSIYVIHDDLDIPLGKYKIQLGKGPKEHRGVVSIEQALADKNFWRVRIGVDNRQATQPNGGQASDKRQVTSGDEYVLSNFPKGEMAVIKRMIGEVADELWAVLSQ